MIQTQTKPVVWNDLEFVQPQAEGHYLVYSAFSDVPVWLAEFKGGSWKCIQDFPLSSDIIDAWAELPDPPDIENTPPSGFKTARNVNPSAMGYSTHRLGRCDVCGHLTSQPTTIDGRVVCPICRSEMLIIKGRSQ